MTDDRGSVLLLFPAGVLIVLVLGAIAVDLSVVYLGEREALSAATGAANDAAGYGIDEERFRRDGVVALDAERVERAVAAALAGRDPSGTPWRYRIDLLSPTTVRIVVGGEADYVFATSVPGGPDHATVEAVAIADARSR